MPEAIISAKGTEAPTVRSGRFTHIFEHQVYGIAPTEIIYQIAMHYILGPNDEFGRNCQTHFAMADSAQLAREGKLADYVNATFGIDAA